MARVSLLGGRTRAELAPAGRHGADAELLPQDQRAHLPSLRGGSPMWTFEIYSDAGGSYRWRLVAANGQTVASSGDSFASKSNAQEAAENVKKNAGGADIVDA